MKLAETLFFLAWFNWTLCVILDITGNIPYDFVIECIQNTSIGMVVICRSIMTLFGNDNCLTKYDDNNDHIGCMLYYPIHVRIFVVLFSWLRFNYATFVYFESEYVDRFWSLCDEETMRTALKPALVGICRFCIVYYVFACVVILVSRDLHLVFDIAVANMITVMEFLMFVVLYLSHCYEDRIILTSKFYTSLNISPGADSDCVICQSLLDVNEAVCVKTTCGHLYHHECIETWFKQKHTCPMCACEFKDKEIKG